MTNPERISDELRPQTRHDLANLDAFIKAARWNAVSEGGADDFRRNYGTRLIDALEAIARRSPPAQEGMVLDAPAREAGGEDKPEKDETNDVQRLVEANSRQGVGGTDTTAWLIERTDDNIPLWYWEDPYRPGWHDWTNKAHDAKRFATKEEAEAFPDYKLIASNSYIKITEHVFIASPAEPAAHSLQTLAPASDAVKPGDET